MTRMFRLAICITTLTLCLSQAPTARGQGLSDTGVSDTQVGYIDGAIPLNQLRLRFDAGYNFRRPTRAEYFYARPNNPGLPDPERSIDYQEIYSYGEILLTENLSTFLEVPVRFLNPDINNNTAGIGDMNAGFKWAFYNCPGDAVHTFQLRAYAPTGDARRGLGNNHVSIEPAFLFYKQLAPYVAMEGELRYWIPIGGTDFAGDIIRYGIGFHCDVYRDCNWRVTPVTEFVGWTVLDGRQGVLFPSGITGVEDAAGDTIINIKLGLRVGVGQRVDFYGGYGRALTGDTWYTDIARFEARWRF